ncbi:MAG: hypothetical protein IJO87_04435 [Eggerthellaceae bacterium]|nr:hypothetical protein [Eggerthellaceae bacterium]
MSGLGLIFLRRGNFAHPTESGLSAADYIQDGLLMMLDGIEDGGEDGKWMDLVGGNHFENVNATKISNGYSFDGTQYLQCVGGTVYQWGSADERGRTFEIVIEFYGNNATEVAFMMPTGISFGRTTKSLLINSGINQPTFPDPFAPFGKGVMTFSRNNVEGAYINGEKVLSDGSTNFDGTGLILYIGRRPSGSYFKGIVHAIRLYNRVLTKEEILYNQTLDSARFRL